MRDKTSRLEAAIFGGGCFWCTEAVFKRLKGVVRVTSGYAGGKLENPSYSAVSRGTTGHAEAVRVEYDPDAISYSDLLNVFFSTHDPTTPNRQDMDVGEQYRSVIFFTTPPQERQIRGFVEKLDKEKIFSKPVVTQVVKFANFYAAEDYHQDYFAKNPLQPYCLAVINPKIKKLKTRFAHLLKPE